MNRSARFPKPFLSLLHASFRLGDRLVFQNTNWTFHENEHWALLGANGSGKSLFIDALRGKIPLVHGEFICDFQPANNVLTEEIGHVSFDDRKATIHDTIAQSRWNSCEDREVSNVSEFLSYENVMSINPFEVRNGEALLKRAFMQRLNSAVKLCRIESFLDRSLISLSNGEIQRVQIARALCHPLRLLILDEPYTGLDIASRAYFLRLFRHLMRTGLRVLIATTRAEELPPEISNCLYVEDCKIVAAGLKSDILTKSKVKRLLLHSAKVKGSRKAVNGLPALKGRHMRAPFSQRKRMSDRAELIRLQNVSVRYGKAKILQHIDWTVRQGESWALLGPNGSGKTTLLSLLLGDNPQAYANEISVFGRRRGTGESIWDLKRHIGWVSPELQTHFNDAVTCLEVVESGFHDSIGLFVAPSARRRSEAKNWLCRFGIADSAQAPLYSLSAGEQRMVLLARALVKRPKLLILDEPCQGLDASRRALFVRAVDRLIRDGRETAIFVTHRQDEIPPSIRRVLRLNQGRGTVELTESVKSTFAKLPERT